MSANTTTLASMPSQKRPLEEHTSDSGLADQPEAKRPALELKQEVEHGDDVEPEDAPGGATEAVSTSGDASVKKEELNGGASNGEADGVDTASSVPSAAAVLETQPIQSTSSANGSGSAGGNFANQHQDETDWLHIRSIISSAEAATVIGKGGENVTLIRRMSGAKCTVSDYTRGAVERVLTVSGLVDAVAKVSLYVIIRFTRTTNIKSRLLVSLSGP